MNDYEPTPPKRTFSMTVFVHMRGRGRPMPYELEDEDERRTPRPAADIEYDWLPTEQQQPAASREAQMDTYRAIHDARVAELKRRHFAMERLDGLTDSEIAASWRGCKSAKEVELAAAHGALAALRAENWNEDRFDAEHAAERLIQRLENDMIALGLVESHAWAQRLVVSAK